ncbi:uncharacterized protein LOC135559661 isoform X2 [Oncorhynchus nerka]|uniref:uncharacterized protein LOC135559661 isoform X2 n=1 Tax=Oncorhynchus nerka TaxID=8023 RepID=UPI0031B7F3D0
MEVEAEAERPDPCLGLEEEDLPPLSAPPTLSITEEIMQFINQSRVREGMAELKPDIDSPLDESLEDPATEPHPCPLAQQGNYLLLASPTEETYESQDPDPNSPEEITVQLEGSRTKMEDQTLPPCLSRESSEEGGCEEGESTPLPADVIEERPQEESTSAKETGTVGERNASEVEDDQTFKTSTPLSPVNLPDEERGRRNSALTSPTRTSPQKLLSLSQSTLYRALWRTRKRPSSPSQTGRSSRRSAATTRRLRPRQEKQEKVTAAPPPGETASPSSSPPAWSKTPCPTLLSLATRTACVTRRAGAPMGGQNQSLSQSSPLLFRQFLTREREPSAQIVPPLLLLVPRKTTARHQVRVSLLWKNVAGLSQGVSCPAQS